MYNDSVTKTNTANTTCGINCCPQKLPCGICRLTMTTCPLCGTIAYPTWTADVKTMGVTE